MNKTIIGVKFKKPGKIYFFEPKKENFKKGDFVIVDTANGMEFAEVVVENKEMPEEKLSNPLKPIKRRATYKDIKHNRRIKVLLFIYYIINSFCRIFKKIIYLY